MRQFLGDTRGGRAGAFDDLRAHGRQGDSMLVHMNPQEVSGLASLSPDGLTVNPHTGLPEMLKLRDVLPAIATIGASLINPALAVGQLAAISGLATAATSKGKPVERLGRGILAGIGTYGMGTLAGRLGDAGRAVAASGGQSGVSNVASNLPENVLSSLVAEGAPVAATQAAAAEAAAARAAVDAGQQGIGSRLGDVWTGATKGVDWSSWSGDPATGQIGADELYYPAVASLVGGSAMLPEPGQVAFGGLGGASFDHTPWSGPGRGDPAFPSDDYDPGFDPEWDYYPTSFARYGTQGRTVYANIGGPIRSLSPDVGIASLPVAQGGVPTVYAENGLYRGYRSHDDWLRAHNTQLDARSQAFKAMPRPEQQQQLRTHRGELDERSRGIANQYDALRQKWAAEDRNRQEQYDAEMRERARAGMREGDMRVSPGWRAHPEITGGRYEEPYQAGRGIRAPGELQDMMNEIKPVGQLGRAVSLAPLLTPLGAHMAPAIMGQSNLSRILGRAVRPPQQINRQYGGVVGEEENLGVAEIPASVAAVTGIMEGAPVEMQGDVEARLQERPIEEPQNPAERAVYERAVMAIQNELEPEDAQRAIDEFLETFGPEAFHMLQEMLRSRRQGGGIVEPVGGETTVAEGELQGPDVIAGQVVDPVTGEVTADLRVGENEYIEPADSLARRAQVAGLPPTPENGAMLRGEEERALRRAVG